MYHGEEKALLSQEDFERAFSHKEMPEEAQEIVISSSILKEGKIWILKLLQKTGVSSSNTELRRLIEQGGVYFNGERIQDMNTDLPIKDGDYLKVGKKGFFRIKLED